MSEDRSIVTGSLYLGTAQGLISTISNTVAVVPGFS
jgi:hypothetical protein